MAKFLMLGNYSAQAIKGISAGRTKKVTEVIKKSGGRVNSMYALLGAYDLAFLVEFPGIKEALKASVTLAKLTGISFISLPAVTIEEFDRMVG